jgi:hypothetical protein
MMFLFSSFLFAAPKINKGALSQGEASGSQHQHHSEEESDDDWSDLFEQVQIIESLQKDKPQKDPATSEESEDWSDESDELEEDAEAPKQDKGKKVSRAEEATKQLPRLIIGPTASNHHNQTTTQYDDPSLLTPMTHALFNELVPTPVTQLANTGRNVGLHVHEILLSGDKDRIRKLLEHPFNESYMGSYYRLGDGNSVLHFLSQIPSHIMLFINPQELQNFISIVILFNENLHAESIKANEKKDESEGILGITGILEVRNREKASPLKAAVKSGNVAVIKGLLIAGANLAAFCDDEGTTIIDYASENSAAPVIKELLNFLQPKYLDPKHKPKPIDVTKLFNTVALRSDIDTSFRATLLKKILLLDKKLIVDPKIEAQLQFDIQLARLLEQRRRHHKFTLGGFLFF